MDLSDPKKVYYLPGKKYGIIVKEDYTRYSCLYSLDQKSDATGCFLRFLFDVRADDAPSEVKILRSDNGREFYGGGFAYVCRQFCIKQEFTTAKDPEFNGVAECNRQGGTHS